MAVAQGCQAKGAVVAGIAVIANAQCGGVEQADDGCRYRALRGVTRLQVTLDAAPNAPQLGGKGGHAVELGLFALLLPERVVAVLLASPGIAASGLKVALWIGANPDIGIGRRNCQLANALELARVADGLPALVVVDEPVSMRYALPSGCGVRYIGQRLGEGDHVVLWVRCICVWAAGKAARSPELSRAPCCSMSAANLPLPEKSPA